MNQQRKRQDRMTPFVLKDDEAALLFKPDGIRLLVPEGGQELPNVKLAAMIMMRLADQEWFAELSCWAWEMHELGKLSPEHTGLVREPIEQPQLAKQPKPMKGNRHAWH